MSQKPSSPSDNQPTAPLVVSQEARDVAKRVIEFTGTFPVDYDYQKRASIIQLAINSVVQEKDRAFDELVFELTGDEGDDDSRKVLKQYVNQLRTANLALELQVNKMRETLEFIGCRTNHEGLRGYGAEKPNDCPICKAVDDALSTTPPTELLDKVREALELNRAAMLKLEKSESLTREECSILDVATMKALTILGKGKEK